MKATESASSMLISRFRADTLEYGIARKAPKARAKPTEPKRSPVTTINVGMRVAISSSTNCSFEIGTPTIGGDTSPVAKSA